MIRTLYRHRSGTIVLGLPDEQLLAAANDNQARLWIDMIAPSPEEAQIVFEQAFNFHPLAIEDTLNDVHVPKLDNYDRYLFLVFHALSMGDERMDIHTTELDVFLGHNFLITTHTQQMEVIDEFWQEEYHQEQGLAASPVILLYELLDRQIEQYIPIIDRFELRLEDLGDVIFQRKHPKDDKILNDILTAKSSALRMRRILRPQREIVRQLGWEEFAVIPPEVHIYFRDVYDHLARLTDLAESMRDLASSTIETHLALVNHRMNDVMKVLIVLSTIFIPLGVITGVYGMNFTFMPKLNLAWTYPLLWFFFLTIAGGMLYFFRRLNWL